ncbi:MAG: 50S ribosomal protein L29 [Vicinamibacterales bacterium]
MKLRDIKELQKQLLGSGVDELGAKERDLSDQLFRMRIQKSMGQLEVPEKMRTVRRNLARIKTVIRQKQG